MKMRRKDKQKKNERGKKKKNPKLEIYKKTE